MQSAGLPYPRRLPIGAEVHPDGSVSFRVWARNAKTVQVIFTDVNGRESSRLALEQEPEGYFSGQTQRIQVGQDYWLHPDRGGNYPDPASRFQPQGPKGPSRIVNYAAFGWTDEAWPGLRLNGQVLYEIHIGTFTPAGTWEAATARLPELADLGITALEVMPVADFVGRHGWGYDGVMYFAPARLYGTPDDFRRFVDRAHALGMGVVLDVVYNHLGPDGSCLTAFSSDYLSKHYQSEWGPSFNFDGNCNEPVREFFLANARYWIEEFHLDGYRLDATQAIKDGSPTHIITELANETRRAAGQRQTLLIAENEPQQMQLLRPTTAGGCGLDMIWNDDFHRTALVAVTGRREGYFIDHRGTPQEFISLVRHGTVYQGQPSLRLRERRGQSTRGLQPAQFVTYLQNHDQIATSAYGWRLQRLTSPGRFRALTAFWLLAPGTPMFFQGQEFTASSPFLFFADHHPELARAVQQGRHDFLRQFRSLAAPEMTTVLADPNDERLFAACQLDWSERECHPEILALHRDLLQLRREDQVIARQGADGIDGAVLGPEAFVLRYLNGAREDHDRLVLVNLGSDLELACLPEPLLAPPEDAGWETLWSSEHPRYGGAGQPPVESGMGIHLAGACTVVLRPGAALRS